MQSHDTLGAYSAQENTKLIPLTQGKFAIVDAADYEWLSQWKWYYDNGYAVRKEGPRRNHCKIYMHRQLAGTPRGKITDHTNGDGLDNRRANLRICTQAENLRNRGLQRNNTSGYKGAYWHAQAGRWYSKIKAGGKNISLGMFDTAEEAARAYDAAALELYGEFASLNFAEEK